MLHTHSGIMFDVTNPKSENILIEDIAHALSLDCRYGCHCNQFYSVAEHCIHLSNLDLDVTSQKVLLLHDATEAYLRDIPTDIKNLPELDGYRKLEDQLYIIIMNRFGLPSIFDPKLKNWDYNIRVNEIEVLFNSIPDLWQQRLDKYTRISGLEIQCWPSIVVEKLFLERFNELFGGQ